MDHTSLQLFSRFASSQPRLSTDALDDPRIPPSGTPAWFTLNLRGSYQLSTKIQLSLSIENILDRLYREHGSGINAPGRNFILSFKIAN